MDGELGESGDGGVDGEFKRVVTMASLEQR